MYPFPQCHNKCVLSALLSAQKYSSGTFKYKRYFLVLQKSTRSISKRLKLGGSDLKCFTVNYDPVAL